MSDVIDDHPVIFEPWLFWT